MVKVWQPVVVVKLEPIPKLTEKLENVSGLKFDTPYFVRTPSDFKFDDSLSARIGVTYNVYIKRHALECKAPSWSPVKKYFANFRRQASNLHTTMRELARESDDVSEIIRDDVNSELVRRNPNSQEKDPFNVLLEQVGHLRASIEEAQENASNLYGGKPGSEGHENLHRLISQLADIFEAAGGVASTTYVPIEDKRDSPFLRFLHAFYSALPDHVRWHTDSALNEQAKRVLEERKEERSN